MYSEDSVDIFIFELVAQYAFSNAIPFRFLQETSLFVADLSNKCIKGRFLLAKKKFLSRERSILLDLFHPCSLGIFCPKDAKTRPNLTRSQNHHPTLDNGRPKL